MNYIDELIVTMRETELYSAEPLINQVTKVCGSAAGYIADHEYETSRISTIISVDVKLITRMMANELYKRSSLRPDDEFKPSEELMVQCGTLFNKIIAYLMNHEYETTALRRYLRSKLAGLFLYMNARYHENPDEFVNYCGYLFGFHVPVKNFIESIKTFFGIMPVVEFEIPRWFRELVMNRDFKADNEALRAHSEQDFCVTEELLVEIREENDDVVY